MSSFDADGVFLQCAFALGQGAGARRRVRASALSDLKARFGSAVEELSEEQWNEVAAQVLRKVRLIGEVAATMALADRRELIDSDDLIAAAHEVAGATLEQEEMSTSLCVTVKDIGLSGG